MLYEYIGTGRARCNICKKQIPKGVIGVAEQDYHLSHKYCRKCVKKLLNIDYLEEAVEIANKIAKEQEK